MSVKGTFTYTEKDYLKFNLFHSRNFFLIFGVMLIILAFMAIAYGVWLQFSIGLAATAAALGIMYYQSKRNYKTSTLRGIEVENIFDETGIHQKNTLGETNLPYNLIYKVCETKEAFYVYISKIQAFIVQKRYFEKPEDIETVKELFKNNLPAKQLKLR